MKRIDRLYNLSLQPCGWAGRHAGRDEDGEGHGGKEREMRGERGGDSVTDTDTERVDDL